MPARVPGENRKIRQVEFVGEMRYPPGVFVATMK